MTFKSMPAVAAGLASERWMVEHLFIVFSYGICWLVALAIACTDAKILMRGRIDDDTNMTGIPTDELRDLARNATFIRLVAGIRLAFAVAFLMAGPAIAICRLAGTASGSK
jgi:hypothetical protein